MLVMAQGMVAGWDLGFEVLKAVERLLGYKGSWNKYIRLEYEVNQAIEANSIHEIREIYLPLISQTLETIQRLRK
jgi:hypothetical protein